MTETAETVQRQWGAVAAAYATSAVHRDGPDLQALIAAAGLTGREQVLDLGCGAGHTAHAAAARAAHVVGVDVTPEMLNVATELAAERGLTNVEFRRASVESLPFADGSFDVVTSRFSAHHYADPGRALAEAARVLRPGGIFLLADSVAPEEPALDSFNNAVELLRDPSHARNCRVSEWRRLLDAAGLQSEMLLQDTIDLDGESWVARSRTASERIAALRALFTGASPAARAAFAIRSEGNWGWRIPIVLLRGHKAG